MNRRSLRAVRPFVFLLLLLIAATATAADKIEVVESETGFYYTIQKGDTLWDLSQHFSDSPWLWPELWEDNDQISNPHWIYPGERIRLYKKSGSQTLIQTDQQTPIVVVPEPVEPVQPKVEEKKRVGPFYVFDAIDRVGFIRKPEVQPVGNIFDVQDKKWMISEGDVVYVNPSNDEARSALIPGSRHTIFRYMQPTEERNSMETIGVQHYILGILEVTELKEDLAICKILKSYRAMKVDDLLMPYSQRHMKIALTPSTPGIDGRIINSEDHTRMTGWDMIAFIDKGTADDIKVGQQYSVYSQAAEGLKGQSASKRRLPPQDIATILVLHTELTTSTVVVTSSLKIIEPGERFRTPIK